MKIAIIGPSGSGKTTIIDGYIKLNDSFTVMRNFTTRAQRSLEDNEFNFVVKDEFEKLIENNFFFEYECIFDNYYGTPMSNLTIENVFFNIDVKGAMKLKEKLTDLIIVFVIPPTKEELLRRLQRRNCGSDIHKRISRAEHEISHHHIADYFIVNDNVEAAINTLSRIINEKTQVENRFHDIVENFFK